MDGVTAPAPAPMPAAFLGHGNPMNALDHLALGAQLAPLREAGVLIVGSGNVVHNLRAVDFARPESGYDWAQRFDEAFRDAITGAPAEVAALDAHPDFTRAVPTPDHYLPALYLAGLADAAGQQAQELVGGCAYGSLSMAAYTIGMPALTAPGGDTPAAGCPTEAPPESSNL